MINSSHFSQKISNMIECCCFPQIFANVLEFGKEIENKETRLRKRAHKNYRKM